MDERAAIAELADAVRGSGLAAEPGTGGVALLSGGADSCALVAALAEVHGADRIAALHLNYGLRPDSGEDERACATLCERLGVELVVERAGPAPGDGNVQSWAREARYRAAEELRTRRGLDWVAAGHTRTDLAETVIYRLAASPGVRGLLGMPESRGRLIRPLLGLERERVRELAVAAALPFRDDPSNASSRYARNRIRSAVLPELSRVSPAAERNIAATQAELRADDELLERMAYEAASRLAGDGRIAAAELAALDEPVARRVLRLLAERAAGGPMPLGADRASAVLRLAAGEGGALELGGGVTALAEQGRISFAAGPAPEPPDPVSLAIGGSCRFGGWTLGAEVCPPRLGGEGVVLDRRALEDPMLVRSWRDGDRMRPLGLDGVKSLQDLFTDRRVPRSERRVVPVVESAGEIAWVAGVEIGDRFRITPGSSEGVRLTAEPVRN